MPILRVVAAAFSLLAVNAITCAALASPSIERCLEQADQSFLGAAVRETFRPSPVARYDNILADARGVIWRPRQPRRGVGVARYAVAFNGTGNCWIGGKIVGPGQSSRTAPSAMAVGAGYGTRNTAIHLLDINRTLNGIWAGPDAFDLRLENVLLSEIKDTCIVADHEGDLIVDKVFFHKCGRVVKLETQSAGSTFTIRNSIIRINDGRNARGRGRLFNGRSIESKAQVYFEDNVVVTAAKLDARSLSILEANCSDNTLIWLGNGDYPGDLPDCFTVVEGKKAWREVRRAWMEQHQKQLAELGEPADPGGSGCAVPEVPASPLPRRTVGSGTPASCTESALRSALSGGGSVTFSCGPAPVTIPIGSELVVANHTALDGGGTVTLDGQGRTRIIRNHSQLTLKRITLTRGRKDVVWSGSPDGGGAVNTTYGNRLYVVDSAFVDNRTSAQGFGGALFQAGAGALTVVRSRFESNVGGGGGAIYNLLARLRVVDSAFVRNRGTSGRQGGGGVMTDGASAGSGNGASGGEILICGSSFDANQALATGGGAYLYAYRRDRVSVTRSTFTGNAALANAGGLSLGGGLRLGAAPALVSHSILRNNTARTGGAIATNDAPTRVEASTFECNSSDIAGGNVRSEGNTMLGCQLR